MSTQIRPELIDELMEMYVEWREECLGLNSAYERWLNLPIEDGDLAFAAYRAALDREEQASTVYADRVDQISRELAFAQRPIRPGLALGAWSAAT